MIGKILKIGLWLAALVGVCYFAQQPAVADSLLLLFTLGEIPGTNIVLSPDTTFWVVGVLIVLTILLVFGSNMYRGLRRLFAKPAITPELATEASTAQVSPVDAMDIAPTIEIQAEPAVPEVVTPKAPSKLRLLASRIAATVSPSVKRQLSAVLVQLQKGALIAKKQLLRASSQLTRGIWFVLNRAGAVAERAIDISAKYAKLAWLRIEPVIRRFDAWLGAQVRSNDTLQAILHIGREISRVLSHWHRSVRAFVGLPNVD